MSSQTQKVALPAYLPKRLQAFRIGNGTSESYLLRDKFQDKNYDFEPWQFFILEVLPSCQDFARLASAFEGTESVGEVPVIGNGLAPGRGDVLRQIGQVNGVEIAEFRPFADAVTDLPGAFYVMEAVQGYGRAS